MQRNAIKHGAIAGILGATTVVLWFFVIDLIGGRLFYTPNVLASVLTGSAEVASGFGGLTLVYTVIHYALFILIGVLTAAALARMGSYPGMLLGFVVGFLLFDLFFYAGAVATGRDVLQMLGWPQVLVGNILAGLVLVLYLDAAGIAKRVRLSTLLGEHRIVREGIITGLIGAVVVALWFLVLDIARHELFFTPAALGSALFHGVSGSREVQITLFTVGGYTLIHLAAFLITGFAAAAIATHAEHEPPLILGFVLLFVTFETMFIGLIAIFASWLLEEMSWWSVLLANILAAAAMGTYLWRKHPILGQDLREGRDLEALS